MPDRAECLAVIEQTLGSSRRKHSVCVAKQAVRLVELYAPEEGKPLLKQKAEIAGLLHDVMKEFPKAEALAELRRLGVTPDPITVRQPSLWHAVLGEAFLRVKLGVSDADILNAVRYHTTGRAGMTLFEQIIYIADFTSDDRDYPDARKMRMIVEQSLDAALREAYRYTIMKLADQRQPLHPDTSNAYNEVLTRNPPPELRL